MSSFNSVRIKDTDAGAYVVPVVESFEECCQLQRINVVPELEWRSIRPIRTLVGRGAFSNVFHISLEKSSLHELDSSSGGEFALKRLNSVMPADHRKFRNAACDLALEASLLQRLRHPNIISLHAIKSGDLEEAINFRDFFLVLDFLTITLSSQLRIWKKQVKSMLLKLNRSAMNIRLMDRLEYTVLGVVKGMEYLHEKNIVFRDLKPDNIGYDRNEVVKIFDFGLARDLLVVRKQRQTLGCTGTIRYMANEVCQGIKTKKPYGMKVDVYSFGVVLWEICTLQVAFDGLSNIREHSKMVVKRGDRPSLKSIRIPALKNLIAGCWDPDPSLRPHFAEVRERLDLILAEHKKNDGRTMKNKSRLQKGSDLSGHRERDRTQPLSTYFQTSLGMSKR